jgi:hypothetical protein
MKTFSYTIPNTSLEFPTAVIGPKATIVINPEQGTLFGEWSIYASESALTRGDKPIGKISKTFSGAEVEALKQQHAEILATLYGLAKEIGEGVVGAQ